MNDHLDPTRDHFEDALAGRAPIAPTEAFRQSLLRQTRGVVRRRRIVRRTGFVGLLIAVYAAGALTMRWTQSPESVDVPLARNGLNVPVPESTAAEATPLSPLAMEWQAIDNDEARGELFRKAGDRYLAEFGDVESAIRCYRNALDLGSSSDAAIRPDDSWLMISLKQAKLKEKHDESLGS